MGKKNTERATGKRLIIVIVVLPLVVLLIYMAWAILQSTSIPKVEMPDLHNKTKAEAMELLDGYNFNISCVDAYSNIIQQGVIISQSIDAYKQVPRGADLVLTVSKGKEELSPSPTNTPMPESTPSPTPEPTPLPTPTPTSIPEPTQTPSPTSTVTSAPPQWSDWTKDSSLASNSNYEVETKQVTEYRYRDKEETTSDKESLAGWSLVPEKTTFSWTDWSGWSNWSETSTIKTDSRDVQDKTQYRYRDMQTTTSDQSTLAGWNYSSTATDFGEWSEWTMDVLEAGADEEVETKTEEVNTTKTVYQYSNYYWMDSSGTYRKTSIKLMMDSGNYVYNQTISQEDYKYSGVYTGSGNSVKTTRKYNVVYSAEYSSPLPYSQGNGWTDANGERWWTEESKEVSETVTVTYYRKRKKVYTYHFWKWDDWSAWSDTKAVSSDTKQTESRTVYRYRTRDKVYVYYFEKWSDWSEYSEEKPSEKPCREIKPKEITYYRYRLKAN